MKINKKKYNELIDKISLIPADEWLTQGLDLSVVEVPQDTADPYKWMDEDMDKQPEEPIIDQYLASLTTVVPDVIPSFSTYDEWVEDKLLKLQPNLYITRQDIRFEYDKYILNYREELKEYWLKSKFNYGKISEDKARELSAIYLENLNSILYKEYNEQQDKGTEIS
jgi:hypothetical protein